ncbi:MAG: branched chain amino acid aminotransferase, partial [Christensenella sp.]
MEIKFLQTDELKQKPKDENNLGFGTIFSDYMFIMHYTEGEGWHDAQIKKYEDFQVSPAATVFHYGQEVFEGLKAYRQVTGDIAL